MSERPDAETQTYVWNWYAMYSGQRMQMVNFWLLSVAFLAAGFVQAVINKLYPIAVGVSVVGMIATIAFLGLDHRTRQLVDVAEDALIRMEEQRALDEVFSLVAACERVRSRRYESYRWIIQNLQRLVALAFLLGTVYALVKA